jgi:hypothetical protein
VPSIKLSVTVRGSLEPKYDAAHVKLVDRAVKDWIEQDRKRGIKTIHVAVDDAAAMKELGVPSQQQLIGLPRPEGDRLILIRLGSNPFEIEESRNLAGREPEVEGYRVGNELRYTAIHETT